MNGLRPAVFVTAIFALTVLALSALLPFWLDEVLQLLGTQPGANLAEVVRYVPQNPGGVPLGYLVQHFVLQLLSVSRVTARVPAVIFGIGSVWLVAVLARRIGVRYPCTAAALFGILPISLRYATEARPYSQAVFLSLAALWTGFRLLDRPTAGWAVMHALMVAAGLYTQPFTVFVPAAQALWMAWRGSRRAAVLAAGAVAAGALAFLPWMAYARGGWVHTIATSQFQFVLTARTPLMLVRELTGAGYVGTVCLGFAAWLGWRSPVLGRDWKILLLLASGLCFAGGLAADAAFGYFIAIRQFLWATPPLILLAAEGLASTGRLTRGILLAGLLAASLAASYRHFTSPKEDWEAAANAMATSLTPGACLDVVSPDQALFYEFFRSDLASRRCTGGDRLVRAISPYANAAPVTAPGYELRSEQTTGGTRILVFERRP